ncbi:hypothetical protein OESDEN_22476, partial [Oesophagostomum dentatum]
SQLVALPHSSSVVSQSQKPEPSAISSPTVSTKSTETGTSVPLRSAEETTNGSFPRDRTQEAKPTVDGAVQVSISSPEASSTPLIPAKRPRITEQSNNTDGNAEENAVFLRKKRELELKRLELENEKLEREIQSLINQEKRAKELHNIELRRLRLQMVMMGADLLQEPQREE